MVHLFFAVAEETTSSSPFASLGVDLKSLIIQLITFALVLIVLQRFAFKRIGRILEQRRKTIDDSIRLGQKLEAEKAKLDEDVQKVMREARVEADNIIANGQKEAREIVREAEKSGQRKVESMMADAEARIAEESDAARLRLEKEIAGLVAEATEAVVGEKVDAKKDAEIIEKSIKDQRQK